jgi:Uncharacterized protein, similar to the N-terminal domain of Lon protease
MFSNKLPKIIPIFPLPNAIFFPNTVLPLNIFEKRYIQLINDCLKNERLFGMVQPKFNKNLKTEVYKVGCLGKIINFNEINNQRFIISLSGIIRFKIKEELNTDKLYRIFKVDYGDFMEDLNLTYDLKKKYNDKDLLNKIKLFLKRKNYSIEFNELEQLDFDQLISTIMYDLTIF